MKFNSIFILLICILCCENVKGLSNTKLIDERLGNICGFHNGHRKYIELGETSKVQGTNITVPKVCLKLRKNITLVLYRFGPKNVN
jgi:hypothetical protein